MTWLVVSLIGVVLVVGAVVGWYESYPVVRGSARHARLRGTIEGAMTIIAAVLFVFVAGCMLAPMAWHVPSQTVPPRLRHKTRLTAILAVTATVAWYGAFLGMIHVTDPDSMTLNAFFLLWVCVTVWLLLTPKAVMAIYMARRSNVRKEPAKY